MDSLLVPLSPPTHIHPRPYPHTSSAHHPSHHDGDNSSQDSTPDDEPLEADILYATRLVTKKASIASFSSSFKNSSPNLSPVPPRSISPQNRHLVIQKKEIKNKNNVKIVGCRSSSLVNYKPPSNHSGNPAPTSTLHLNSGNSFSRNFVDTDCLEGSDGGPSTSARKSESLDRSELSTKEQEAVVVASIERFKRDRNLKRVQGTAVKISNWDEFFDQSELDEYDLDFSSWGDGLKEGSLRLSLGLNSALKGDNVREVRNEVSFGEFSRSLTEDEVDCQRPLPPLPISPQTSSPTSLPIREPPYIVVNTRLQEVCGSDKELPQPPDQSSTVDADDEGEEITGMPLGDFENGEMEEEALETGDEEEEELAKVREKESKLRKFSSSLHKNLKGLKGLSPPSIFVNPPPMPKLHLPKIQLLNRHPHPPSSPTLQRSASSTLTPTSYPSAFLGWNKFKRTRPSSVPTPIKTQRARSSTNSSYHYRASFCLPPRHVHIHIPAPSEGFKYHSSMDNMRLRRCDGEGEGHGLTQEETGSDMTDSTGVISMEYEDTEQSESDGNEVKIVMLDGPKRARMVEGEGGASSLVPSLVEGLEEGEEEMEEGMMEEDEDGWGVSLVEALDAADLRKTSFHRALYCH